MKNAEYVDVNGWRTRYFEAGEGEAVILVHGGHFGLGGSAEDWELNFDALSRSHRVFALDKLGMGFTDNPAGDDEYVIERHATHLATFMDAVGVECAHLVGHSRGGYAVTRVALDHPSRVHTLTIVSSSSVTNPMNPIYGEWRERANSMEERDAARYLISANSYSDRHITERIVDLRVEIGRLEKTAEARRRMDEGLFQKFRTDLLQRVERLKGEVSRGDLIVPTLLVWGFDDPSATMERCAKPAMDLFFPAVEKCEMHIVGQAGHYCFREQPEAFNDAILAFMAQN